MIGEELITQKNQLIRLHHPENEKTDINQKVNFYNYELHDKVKIHHHKPIFNLYYDLYHNN